MGEHIKVLVVDDKQVIRDFFDITLGFYGHEITVVQDPELATQLVKQKLFDIAFVDMLMPEKDGVQVLRDVKHACPQLPVVMMSGYSVDDKHRQARELGASECLKKPFEYEDIRRVVKNATGKDI